MNANNLNIWERQAEAGERLAPAFGFLVIAAAALWVLEFLWALWAAPAAAEGFAIYSQGARGAALSGTVLAREPDAGALAHNPALLTALQSDSVSFGVTVIATKGGVDWELGGRRGRTPSARGLWFIPHAFFNYRLSDRWVLGIGEFSRFGLGNEYPPDWPGRFNMYDVQLATSSLNAALAFKATDRLSLAAGLELTYASMSLRNRTLFPVPNVGVAEVDVSVEKARDLAVGFGLSGRYLLGDRWAFGVHYRSKERVRAKGHASFAYVGPDDPILKGAFDATFRDGSVRGVITLPESLAAGLSFAPNARLSVEAGLVWTRWSRYASLDLELPGGLPPSVNPKNWRDNVRFAVGVEYSPLDWLDLRAGYSYTQSPMTAGNADYTVPTDGRRSYSLGLGASGGNWTADLSYELIDCVGREYAASPLDAGGNGTTRSKGTGVMGHEATFTLTYRF
ncbi:MAG: outer membrane protein transport protein [Deltaproteobacteria bacterium]|jgi:long-chain fatty acid transport protein|nr:outer membrane protein transport protein [Deltaproteobacteria bacterium]